MTNLLTTAINTITEIKTMSPLAIEAQSNIDEAYNKALNDFTGS